MLTIKNFKEKMIEKFLSKGIYENFGQIELRKLKEKYHYDPYANKWREKEFKIKNAIDELDEWASHYNG